MDSSRKLALLLLSLAVVTAGLYWRTTAYDFGILDDQDYVVDNPWVNQGVSLAATKWAFTTFNAANWHPLTWLSHQADCSMFGMFAGGHHLTNLLLHTANTLALFLILRNLTGKTGPSWVVAALFAWHPLHVESVAWISERKDLLSTLCLLGSIAAYSRYARERGRAMKNTGTTGETSAWRYYALSLTIFAAGLMCKPMVVTLPCLLLLMDYWPLERIQNAPAGKGKNFLSKLLLEKIPYFALSAGGCALTLAAQFAGGAIKDGTQVPMALRIFNALDACRTYIAEVFFPYPLCIFYPLPERNPVIPALVGAVMIAGATFFAWRQRRERPWFIVGWLWFLGSLVPVIGILQVGSQAHADRYTYIPSIGLFTALVWGIHELTEKLARRMEIRTGVAAASLAACLFLTNHQLGYWQDNVRLYSHALYHTRSCVFLENQLGVAYSKLDNGPEAIVHFRKAIECDPTASRPLYNLGSEYAKLDQLEEAAKAFNQALVKNPHNESILNNLGVVLARQGKYEDAKADFLLAIQWNPSYPKSYLNAAMMYQTLGQAGPAYTNYCETLALDPDYADALRHLAYFYASYPSEPYHQPEKAVLLAKRAADLTQNQVAVYLQTLAVSYAAAGRFGDAVAVAENALRLAQEHQFNGMVAQLKMDLAAYRAGACPPLDWKKES